MPVARLKDTHPVLWGELHVDQEPGIDLSRLTKASPVKPAWLCDEGHRYVARVDHRVNGSGCPYCSGRLPIQGKTDLASQYPELAAEWHPVRNGELQASGVTAASGHKAWWLCPSCQHEWPAVVGNRSKLGRGCPSCYERRRKSKHDDGEIVAEKKRVVKKQTKLLQSHPELAAEWHPTFNGDVTIEEVSTNKNSKVWWLGSCGHSWDMPPINRVRQGQGCPYCAGKRVLAGFNDLETTHPEIAEQWHPTLNDMLPSEVSAGSGRMVWWACARGVEHTWQAKVAYRSRGFGCPVCKSIGYLYPELAAEWHPTKNGTLRPNEVYSRSGLSVWWLGSACGHEWEASPHSRSRGSGCHYCSGQILLPGFNDLASSRPELRTSWLVTENQGMLFEQVGTQASKRYWWKRDCGHHLYASITHVSLEKLQRCPKCSPKNVISGVTDLATRHPDVAAEWHPTKNGTLRPNEVHSGQNRKGWWLCSSCQHEWVTSPAARTRIRSGCPACSGRAVVSGVNDLATVSPGLATEWHSQKNGDVLPQDVAAASGHHFWWACDKGHEWEARPADRTRPNNATGCPRCSAGEQSSKSERIIADYLSTILPQGAVETSVRSVIKGELDIYIPSKQVAVEYNGLYWHSDRHRAHDAHRRHYDKWVACKEKGIQLIQVWEDEWNRNPEQVKKMLAHKLGIQLPGEKRVMARKTQVTAITKQQAEAFLDENHVQGYAAGSYYLALVEPGDAETLLAVLVLKKEAGTEGKTLNIIRYATSATIPGGFTKLLKYAERTYQPESFITFSDHCVSDGGLYRNNGFVADKELKPDYMYVVRSERKHKFGYRLKRFRDDPALQYEEGMTERELAQLNGLPRIWDAGKTRWTKTVTVEQ